MSASSHTRNHRYAAELTGGVLAWLESHGRRVVNDSRALRLEISKIEQYEALKAYGVRTPRTLAAVGRKHIVEAARRMTGPFITKHNRAGKGLGVKLFQSVAALEEHVMGPPHAVLHGGPPHAVLHGGPAFEQSVDGITLIQEYIRAPEPFITRVEFVGGEFLYAVRVDTSLGFELCPADVCQIDDALCPVGEQPVPVASAPRFRIVQDFHRPELVDKYRRFISDHGIDIAGIEFVEDAKGDLYTYDVNTNTNYNPDAEAKDGRRGMQAIALHLKRLLLEQYGSATGLASAA
jgi:hypothetical protein